MTPPKRPTLMMPVSDGDVSMQIILETLRGLQASFSSQNAASAEDRKLLHDMHTRLIRIESNHMERDLDLVRAEVRELQTKFDGLKSDKDRRDGAVGFLEWMGRVGPWLLSFALAVLAMVGWKNGA